MKTYNTLFKSLLTAFVLSAGLTGCSEDTMDKINQDNDHAHAVDARFILTDVITSTAFSNVGGDFNTYGSSYIEYEVGVDNQLYNAEIRLNEPSAASTFQNSWLNQYMTLRNARIAIAQCEEGNRDEGNNVTRGIAEVLAAYNSALIADMFGDAPFSQAALIDEHGSPLYKNPKMDTQEDIYKGVMQYLDDAIAHLQQSDVQPIGSSDLLYNGNSGKWLRFAYGLKARYTMRLLNRSADRTKDLEAILDYIDKSFASAGEQAEFSLYDSNNINPLFGFYDARAALALSESLCQKLAERNDPRIQRAILSPMVEIGDDYKLYQVTGINDPHYVPAPNGSPKQSMQAYGVSAFMYAQTAPTVLLSYHELQFLKAEALCRLNRLPEAEEALKEGVVAGLLNAEAAIESAEDYLGADLIQVNATLDETVAEDYFDNEVEPLFALNPLKETMVQKYLAFWGASGEATEMYNDIRRWKAEGNEYVVLKNTRKFPLRCPYGNSDTTTNPEVKAAYGDGQYVYTEPVWWANGTR
ncbi:MAG: SusD/RagB family nutrient-binding outer membrane lipoprotein [Parabacteroides sp.]|nr:SusD/RagB family nutrient-binding outer membrane lipoprotein [Parabacteroides sp.]